jgi:hypothetical protein
MDVREYRRGPGPVSTAIAVGTGASSTDPCGDETHMRAGGLGDGGWRPRTPPQSRSLPPTGAPSAPHCPECRLLVKRDIRVTPGRAIRVSRGHRLEVPLPSHGPWPPGHIPPRHGPGPPASPMRPDGRCPGQPRRLHAQPRGDDTGLAPHASSRRRPIGAAPPVLTPGDRPCETRRGAAGPGAVRTSPWRCDRRSPAGAALASSGPRPGSHPWRASGVRSRPAAGG